MNTQKKFTVIINAGNSARLLKRTMDSLTRQSVGFSEYIQVILYTGGSSAQAAGKMCASYRNEYKDNVIVQESLDLSPAEGTFINYLQEGQNWHKDAFAQAWELISRRTDEVTVVEELYEEPEDGEVLENHILHIKNHVEKVQQEPGKYLFHSRYGKLVEKIITAKKKLDSDYALIQILLEAGNIGVLKLVKLYGKYVQYPKKTREWYLKSLPRFKEALAELKEQKYQEYAWNLDFLLMYHISESLKDDISGVLDASALEEYKEWLKGTLAELDDYIIARGKMNGATRRYAFSLKYGIESVDEMIFHGGKLLFHNLVIYNLARSVCFQITGEKHTQQGNNISGVSKHPLPLERIRFFLTDGCGMEYPFEETGKEGAGRKCLDMKVIREMEYECLLPANVKKENLTLMYRYDDIYIGEVSVE